MIKLRVMDYKERVETRLTRSISKCLNINGGNSECYYEDCSMLDIVIVIRYSRYCNVDRGTNRKAMAFKIPSKNIPSSLSENEAVIYVLSCVISRLNDLAVGYVNLAFS